MKPIMNVRAKQKMKPNIWLRANPCVKPNRILRANIYFILVVVSGSRCMFKTIE